MYSWKKSFSEDKSRKNPQSPSFSIYTTDDDKDQNLKFFNRERSSISSAKKHSQSISNGGMASLGRACFNEERMEKQANENVSSRRNPSAATLFQEDDTWFFSTTPGSSAQLPVLQVPVPELFLPPTVNSSPLQSPTTPASRWRKSNDGGKRKVTPPFSQDSVMSEPQKTRISVRGVNQGKHTLRMDTTIRVEVWWDDEDAASDCSSDLFQIDNLTLFGKSRLREELPVYETTHLDTDRANGLIR